MPPMAHTSSSRATGSSTDPSLLNAAKLQLRFRQLLLQLRRLHLQQLQRGQFRQSMIWGEMMHLDQKDCQVSLLKSAYQN